MIVCSLCLSISVSTSQFPSERRNLNNLFCLFHNTQLQNIWVLTIPLAPWLSYQTCIWTYTIDYNIFTHIYTSGDDRLVHRIAYHIQSCVQVLFFVPSGKSTFVESNHISKIWCPYVVWYFSHNLFCSLPFQYFFSDLLIDFCFYFYAS